MFLLRYLIIINQTLSVSSFCRDVCQVVCRCLSGRVSLFSLADVVDDERREGESCGCCDLHERPVGVRLVDGRSCFSGLAARLRIVVAVFVRAFVLEQFFAEDA